MVEFSIIIPTYNSAQFILPCLDSIFRQSAVDFEIILVDNGSEDNTTSLVRNKYPKVSILTNKINLGASRARNQGLAATSYAWVLVLDCDTVLENNFLETASKIISTLPPGIGLIQPKILDAKQDKIYSAGIKMSFLKRFQDIGKGSLGGKKIDVSGYIFGACCAAALYRREMLEEIKDRYGYFDERFFFLFEDVDLSWRGQKKGWICLYDPRLSCRHHGNSSRMENYNRQFLSFINRQRTILKNQNPFIILLMFPLYLVYDLPRFFMLAVKFKCKFPKF